MPALTINGLLVPVLADTFDESITEVGDIFARATTGKSFSSLGVRKRRWTFTTGHLSSLDANSLRGFIEGNALSFDFNFSLQSGAGVANTNVATVIGYAAGKHGNAVELSSGTHFAVDMSNKVNVPGGWTPSLGWTLIFWAYHTIAADSVPADGWYHYVVTGASTVIAGALANPVGVTQYRNGVAGSYNLGRVINVDSASNFVGVKSRTLNNVDANKRFDDFVFLPFTIPTAATGPWLTSSWANQIWTFHNLNPWPAAPIVKVAGDHLDAPGGFDGVFATGLIERVRHMNATLPGSSSMPNVKTMDVVLEEA